MNESAFIHSIVRITDASGQQTLGTGFVVGQEGYIVTAAHVVAGSAVTSTDELTEEFVSFEFLATKKPGEAAVIRKALLIKECFVPYLKGDLAVLQYMHTLPSSVTPLALGSSVNRTGDDAIKTFGFPGVDNHTGTYGSGRLMGALKDRSLEFEVLQINTGNIVEGFSGAPVVNLITDQIIGFVSWIDRFGAAFIVPTEQIVRFLGDHPVVNGVDISDPGQITFYYRQQHQLDPERYFIDKVRQDTVAYITKQHRFDTIQSGVDLLGHLKLNQTHQLLPTNITVENFWLGVLAFLQYSKISYIIEIIMNVTPRFNQAEAEALIESWKKIEENPYNYIFEEYLQKIITNNDIFNLTEKYVELMGEHTKDIQSIDQKAVEIKKQYKNYKEDANENEPDEAPRIDSILNIARDEERFIIIGRPGSGKTITLQKILFKNAEDFSSGDSELKIPIFVTANKYNDQIRLHNLISKELPDWSNSELDKSRFVLLIDGINEINPAFQDEARSEIKKLLEEYERTSFIISTRKYGFLNEFDLSLFELKPLQPAEVKQYIYAYRPEFAQGIWDAIHEENNGHLLDLSSNPLTLFMIIYAYDDKALKILPENRGGVYREFINKLLEIDKKKLHIVNKEQWRIKEKALSELAMKMRKTEFNTPLHEVFHLFNQTLGNYRLAVNLVHDLCSSHILRVSGIVNGRNMDNHSIENAPENSTVSFIHETFLEYFCALEMKHYFISNKRLDVEFNQVEWFETLMLTADLLEDEAVLTEYLSYLFDGGQRREVAFKDVATVIKGGKLQIKTLNFNLKETFKPEYYTNFAIACKIAYSAKTRFPACYALVESWLYRECSLWMRYANWKYRDDKLDDFTPYPVKHLLAAIAGLSSPALVFMAFSRKEWQTVWLLYEATEPQLREREENVEAFINNLSNFSLLYDLLIELGFHLSFGEDTLRMLEEQMKQKMPLNLQKKLFERSPETSLDLLERIGKQDPEFFIEKFDDTKASRSVFVDYLEDFSANKQVQNKLIQMLNAEALEPELRDKILTALLKKYYCIPQLLEYIQENFEAIQTNTSLFSRIKRFLFGLPWKSLTPKLTALLEKQLKSSFPSYKELYLRYASTLFARKHQGKVQLLKITLSRKAIKGYEYSISVTGFQPPSEGVFLCPNGKTHTYQLQSKNKRSFTIVSPEPSVVAEQLNAHVTIDGYTYRIGNVYDSKRFVIIGPVEGTFLLNGMELPFHSGSYQLSTQDYQKRFHITFASKQPIDFNEVKAVFKGMDEPIREIALENLLSEEIVEETYEVQTLDGAAVEVDCSALYGLNNIHPDLFDRRIIETLQQYAHLPEVQAGIKDGNLVYLFHNQIKDINFGIVVRIFTIYNSVEVYSPSRNAKYFINMPSNRLKEYKENQLVIVEKDYHIHPFQYQVPETDLGFKESFVIGIFKDYLFIHNPDSKDYFIHKSRINFIPVPYDRVVFYPSINLSRRYYFYPTASLISRTGEGTYELLENFNANLEARIRKAKSEVELGEGKVKTLVHYTKLLLKAEDYKEALKNAQTAVKKKPADPEPKLLAGDSFLGLNDYGTALDYYRRIYKYYNHDGFYLKKLVRTCLGSHNLELAYQYLLQYFRNNRVYPESIDLATWYAAILSYRKLDRSLEYLLNGLPDHLEPYFADYFVQLAEFNGKKQEKAFELFEKAVALQNSEANFLTYAVFLFKMGDLSRSNDMLNKAVEFAPDATSTKLEYHRQLGKIERIKFNRITLTEEDIPQSVKLALALIKQKKYTTVFRLLEALRRIPEMSEHANDCIDLLKHSVFKYNPQKMLLNLLACYRAELKAAFSPFLLMEYMSYLIRLKQYRSLIDSVKHSFLNELKLYPELQFLYLKAQAEDALEHPISSSGELLKRLKHQLEALIDSCANVAQQSKYRIYLVRMCHRWMPQDALTSLLPHLDQVIADDFLQFKAHDLCNLIKLAPEDYKKVSRSREEEAFSETDE